MLAAVAAQVALSSGVVQIVLPLAMSFEVALPLGVPLVEGHYWNLAWECLEVHAFDH